MDIGRCRTRNCTETKKQPRTHESPQRARNEFNYVSNWKARVDRRHCVVLYSKAMSVPSIGSHPEKFNFDGLTHPVLGALSPLNYYGLCIITYAGCKIISDCTGTHAQRVVCASKIRIHSNCFFELAGKSQSPSSGLCDLSEKFPWKISRGGHHNENMVRHDEN